MAAPDWFISHLGWKQATSKSAKACVTLFGEPLAPNLADLGSVTSLKLAGYAYSCLGIPPTKQAEDLGASDTDRPTKKQQATGAALEAALESDLAARLADLNEDVDWYVTRQGRVDQFSQFEHLAALQHLFLESATLRSTIGRSYHVSTDVMVAVPNQGRGTAARSLHAAVSSKLTIRSDRVQNIRFEFGTLVRNRRGRLPHLVVVTAEPLPSRVASIAQGTGEIDAVYHLLYDEIGAALASPQPNKHLNDQRDHWMELVETGRLRPYEELPRVLALS